MDDLPVLLARLDERMAGVARRLDALEQTVSDLNRLATYGRVALSLLIGVGVVLAWLIAQTKAVRDLFWR